MGKGRPVPPLRVFLSYSHQDDELCEQFLKHLSELKRQRLIEPWHDRRITPGAEWAGAIDAHLEAADIIILLVSADFLASDYCNDVEMKRALERSQSGGARVVPVILRPCDWEASRFAGFQALPKGGKPVVDWPTADHGFTDTVKGLRRLIAELCGSAPVVAKVLETVVRRHPWRWACGAVFAAGVIALVILLASAQRYLNQGTDLLNTGQYAAARPLLARAKSLNPLSRAVGCAWQAVELDASHVDERQIEDANREFPKCPYLLMLRGDRKYMRDDLAGALDDYQEAAKSEPKLAEAHFNLGIVLDRQGKPDSALPEYRTAVQLSPGIPRYHQNLADAYFRAEAYDNAIEEYGYMGEFPLAALELAKIYCLQNKLEEAQGREEDAARWLKDPAVQRVEEQNQNGWLFEVGPLNAVRLGPLVEKQCYADLELALTRFLAGDEGIASVVRAAFEKCSSRKTELKEILTWELHKLGSQNAKVSERADKFAEWFLGVRPDLK